MPNDLVNFKCVAYKKGRLNMENLKKLIESRIGNICKFQNDSKNYMDKDKYYSLKGRTDRIITAAQEIIDGLNECIEILENESHGNAADQTRKVQCSAEKVSASNHQTNLHA